MAAPFVEPKMVSCDELPSSQWKYVGLSLHELVDSGYNMVSVTSVSESDSRLATASGPFSPGEITPEIADARQFEERLERGLKDGAFLALLVTPKNYQRLKSARKGQRKPHIRLVRGADPPVGPIHLVHKHQ